MSAESALTHLVEVGEYTAAGYETVVRYGAWRVAVLNYIDELEPHRIGNIQKHDETDEVFVLLRGRCILFLVEFDDKGVPTVHPVDMVPLRLYNVKRGVWHSHTLDAQGSVLVIENEDTGLPNSPVLLTTDSMREQFVAMTKKLWGAAAGAAAPGTVDSALAGR